MTDSALFGGSKSPAFKKKIVHSKIVCEFASHYGSPKDFTTDEMVENGSKVLVSLYGGNIETSGLNALHYEQYMKKMASAKKRI